MTKVTTPSASCYFSIPFFCMCKKRGKNENRYGKMKSNNQCGCVAVWGPWAYLGRRKALRSNAVQRISTLSPAFTRANFHFVLHTFAAHFNWAIAIQNLCQSLWRNGMSLLAPSRCQFAWRCNFILFHLIFSGSQQLCDNEISIRNLYACVVLPFLSH